MFTKKNHFINIDISIDHLDLALTNEGKNHKLVINSIRCKLVNRVFAVSSQARYSSICCNKFTCN